MVRILAERWWSLAVRGGAAILFGILCLVAPRATFTALVLLFGAYAIVDGVFNLVMAFHSRARRRWVALALEGVVSLLAGILTLAWPSLTGLALIYLIAGWSLVTGGFEIAAAIRLRSEIQGEWLLVVSGILSVAFGVLLIIAPGAGALALTWWVGAYAMVFGILLLFLAFRLRSWARSLQPRAPERELHVPA